MPKKLDGHDPLGKRSYARTRIVAGKPLRSKVTHLFDSADKSLCGKWHFQTFFVAHAEVPRVFLGVPLNYGVVGCERCVQVFTELGRKKEKR